MTHSSRISWSSDWVDLARSTVPTHRPWLKTGIAAITCEPTISVIGWTVWPVPSAS